MKAMPNRPAARHSQPFIPTPHRPPPRAFAKQRHLRGRQIELKRRRHGRRQQRPPEMETVLPQPALEHAQPLHLQPHRRRRGHEASTYHGGGDAAAMASRSAVRNGRKARRAQGSRGASLRRCAHLRREDEAIAAHLPLTPASRLTEFRRDLFLGHLRLPACGLDAVAGGVDPKSLTGQFLPSR